MAKAVVNPEAQLPPRARDVQLTEELLAELSVFAALKKSPAFSKFPGTCVLRHYRPNEVICRQGDAGGTAFYMLTAADVAALRQKSAGETPDTESTALPDLRRLLQSFPANLQMAATADPSPPRRLATARLMVDMSNAASARSWWRGRRASRNGADSRPAKIANDGPADIDYDTRQAPIYEGEVFGEMSCLTRQPRSATVVVDTECFVFEFLRNILEQMRKDAKYNDEAAKKYRERVLEGHLRQLSIFQFLSPEDFKRVQAHVELVSFTPGAVIWDEGDPSDALYVVRSGIVQVKQSFPWRLAVESVSDWPKLWSALRSADDANPAISKLRKALPKAIQDSIAAIEGDPPPDLRLNLVAGLNEVAKTDVLLAAKELQATMADPRLTRETASFSGKVKSWTGLQIRRANRILWHVLFSDAVSPAPPAGLARVMQYLGRGGILGEIGVMRKKPRTAACLAYSHPQADREATDVELVRVPAELVYEIEAQSPRVRAEIENLIVTREERSIVSSQAPIGALAESRRAEELGLMQGQNLMLIDLDRCTRCGDCVKACIDTHDDGYSRLFLDGPRFGKYLVPSSCRQCRDPVCMIGCPVGSIQQGDDGEIRIREWCIGCGLCANQCPYDSIQMHDAAALPSGAPGWWWSDDREVPEGETWFKPSFQETNWRVASAPFSWGLQMHLASQRSGHSDGQKIGRLYFRTRFRVDRNGRSSADRHRLLITSQGGSPAAYMNGRSLELTQDAPQKKRFQYACDFHGKEIRRGENVLAVTVVPPDAFDVIVLDARLDALAPESEEVEEKLVTERAVVCDQCSSLSGDRHACVYACPHEAALRVDAWVNFPTS